MKTCKNPDCCQDMAHTMELKACKDCRKAISGGNCMLCPRCSTESNRCGHCMEKFN